MHDVLEWLIPNYVKRVSDEHYSSDSSEDDLGTHHDLPSHATRYNYHHAVVIRIVMARDGHVSFTILPMPAYSSADPGSGLSSTSWLLAQPDDFQRLHIPVPFEEDHTHTLFPTPAGFGTPLQISGWKSTRPSWVQAVPQAIELEKNVTVSTFLLERDYKH